MTRYRTQLSRKALDDLEEYVTGLAKWSVDAAVRWHQRIDAVIASLETFPERCPLAPESSWYAGLRETYHGKQRSAYRILFEVRGEIVYIVRVRHGRQQTLELEDL